ncbi:hypothetical protein KXW36_001313, partial [Aspergillus fumigatus]
MPPAPTRPASCLRILRWSDVAKRRPFTCWLTEKLVLHYDNVTGKSLRQRRRSSPKVCLDVLAAAAG